MLFNKSEFIDFNKSHRPKLKEITLMYNFLKEIRILLLNNQYNNKKSNNILKNRIIS